MTADAGIELVAVDIFEWRIEVRNDRMGFNKTFTVDAAHIYTAIDQTFAVLESQGYDNPDEFNTVKAVRGTIVRREAGS